MEFVTTKEEKNMETKSSTFERGLDNAAQKLGRIKLALENTKRLAEAGMIEDAYISAFTLAHEAEQLTLLTRVLPAYTGNPQAVAVSEQMLMDTVPVKIGFTRQGWFGVLIPALLPKKSKGSPDYIRSILYPAMRRFFYGKEPVSYPDCVLIFRHVYDRKRPERIYRDHDNIELNMVADIIALYVMKDDAALRCAHYYCSTAGDGDRTEVYVVHQSEFTDWLAAEKSFPDEGVELLENYP